MRIEQIIRFNQILIIIANLINNFFLCFSNFELYKNNNLLSSVGASSS